MKPEQGTYHIQGVALKDIAAEFGSPVYVYDAEKITSQVQKLQKAFSQANLKIKFAAKALTSLSVLQLLRQKGTHFDAVSINEVKIGLRAGFKPEEILFTPNFAPFSEVEEAVALGALVNIDNTVYLEKFGQRYGHSVPCCLRINPNIRAGGNEKIQVGHDKSKFGIPAAQLQSILQIVEQYNIQVKGLHKHTGSDIKEAEAFTEGAGLLFKLAMHFKELRFLDFGGGFKVRYREEDPSLDIDKLGHMLSEALRTFSQSYGRELELWIEPGKFLVSEAGLLLAQVTLLKDNPSGVFAGLDTGLNHLIRPMMYGAYHGIVNISNPEGAKKNYNVVGYICETDTFAEDRPLNEIREGDLLAIQNAGAYSFSMSSNYNSRPRPAEVLVYKGKPHLIRKRETFEELLQNQIDIFDRTNPEQ